MIDRWMDSHNNTYYHSWFSKADMRSNWYCQRHTLKTLVPETCTRNLHVCQSIW